MKFFKNTFVIEIESVLGKNPSQKQGNNILFDQYKRGYLNVSSHIHPYTISPSFFSYTLFYSLLSQAFFQIHQSHIFDSV